MSPQTLLPYAVLYVFGALVCWATLRFSAGAVGLHRGDALSAGLWPLIVLVQTIDAATEPVRRAIWKRRHERLCAEMASSPRPKHQNSERKDI